MSTSQVNVKVIFRKVQGYSVRMCFSVASSQISSPMASVSSVGPFSTV